MGLTFYRLHFIHFTLFFLLFGEFTVFACVTFFLPLYHNSIQETYNGVKMWNAVAICGAKGEHELLQYGMKRF